MNRNLLKSITAMAAVALVASVAQATPLLPNNVPVVPNAGPNPLAVSGNIIANTGPMNFTTSSGGVTENGTGQEWVVKNYSTNPYGGLSFIIQFSVTSGTTGGFIDSITAAVFSGFLTDVQYFVNAANQVAPTDAIRSNDGSTVKFRFAPGDINPGQASAFLIINTNATLFTNGVFTAQNGVVTQLQGYAPTVPENGAGSAVLLLVGLGSLAFGHRMLKGSKVSA